jgi:hypothetical protein
VRNEGSEEWGNMSDSFVVFTTHFSSRMSHPQINILKDIKLRMGHAGNRRDEK